MAINRIIRNPFGNVAFKMLTVSCLYLIGCRVLQNVTTRRNLLKGT